MDKKLNSLALGYAGAVISAISMLILGVLSNLGIYVGAGKMMQQWHMFFSFSVGGIVAGMVEASIISFIFLYFFGLIYNEFSK